MFGGRGVGPYAAMGRAVGGVVAGRGYGQSSDGKRRLAARRQGPRRHPVEGRGRGELRSAARIA
eukprot:2474559-Lingulodinium_polyedra.AAC.1